MIKKEIKIGTRGSKLALTQAEWVKDRLIQKNPYLNVSLIKIKTTGDKIQDAPLAKIGGKGLFVKEIEEALLDRKIDIAVHSVKDVPTELPNGLQLSVITKREDPRDVLISRNGLTLEDLPPGSTIGTSSLRRQVQLINLRKDFNVVPLRGNLDTRLKKLVSGDLNAIIVALAGVKRLGLENMITEIIPIELIIPAIGQGALGIEIRIGDEEIEKEIQFLNDEESFISISAERAFLKRLGGGCQVPIAAFGRIEGDSLRLDAMIGSTDGRIILKKHLKGNPKRAESLGIELAERFLEEGAKEILNEFYII
jgi:hydroxymethylbilane synthase